MTLKIEPYEVTKIGFEMENRIPVTKARQVNNNLNVKY